MSFSLVCQMSHKKKSVKGEPKLAEFTLDTLFLMATMSEGKMLVRPFRYSLMGSIVHSKMRK